MEAKKTPIVLLLIVVLLIGIAVYEPLLFFYISLTASREFFGAFLYAYLSDIAIMVALFFLVRRFMVAYFNKTVFSMTCIENKLIFQNKNGRQIQCKEPDVVYRDCYKNKKIQERTVGLQVDNTILFLSFDKNCDMRCLDKMFRNKYSTVTQKICGKPLRIIQMV